MKTLHAFTQFVVLVSLPLLLGGCGGDKKEPVAEVKPVEEVPVNPNLKYEIKGDAATITGCDKKASGALIIPATIEGKSVTSIGDKAFYGCNGLTNITIPDSVTSIEMGAFAECTSLTSITIPDGITSIGEAVFYDCANLTSITIPDSVTSIGDGAFYGCTSLTSITIPNSVTSIGDGAFAGCSSLKSIMIPDSVTSIGVRAFVACESLTSITIPAGVTSIGEEAFSWCVILTAVTFLGDAPEVGSDVYSVNTTIYRKPEAKGWGDTFAGRPVKLISEKPDQKISIKSPKGSLEESIVGKVFTLEREGQRGYMVFRTDGGFLSGQDRDLEDLGMAYKVEGNTVLILVDGKEIGGVGRIVFSYSSPKVGDQLEWGPNEDDKRKFTIIKIEAANEIINDPVRQKQQEVDSALSVEQAEALLARGLGQWEGSGVIKGADGEVLAEIPLFSTVRWLEEGDEGFRKNGKESGESKVQQMRVTEKLPQGDNVTVLTRWYDSRKGLFLLTRRLPGEELPVDPGAEETYEADTETYLGIVRKGIPPGTSFTWTSQMTNEKWIYRGKFLENGKLGWTRVDTQKPVKAEPIDSLEESVAEISIWDAIHQGNIEAVKTNLARGFDIASKDAIYDGTPLHHAAYSGQNEVALFLINKGANVNAIGGPKGYPAMETPLDVAIRRAQNRTIDLLRKHRAKTVKELKAEAE